jgi:membrane-anchored glycerophosphoryl diester phosphodiesterase (GDPDase)
MKILTRILINRIDKMIVNLEKDIWTLRFQDQKLLSLAKRLYFIAYFALIIPVTALLHESDISRLCSEI